MPLTDEQERLEAIGDQLRAKISSKFAASTFLAGFAATILAAVVSPLWQQDSVVSVHFPIAVGLAVAGTGLFITSIVRFDELSMPKRFWPSDPQVHNQAGDVGLLKMNDLWALHDRMVFFWRCLTLVGTALTGLALFVLIAPQAHIDGGTLRKPAFLWACGGAIAVIGYGWVLNRRAPHRHELLRPVD
jgi:hypothetical protein